MEGCYEDTMFVTTLSDSDPLRCVICGDIMKEAVQCPQQHLFGRACLEKALQVKSECPNCREPLQQREVQPSRAIRSIIDRMDVYCPRRKDGCTATIKLQDLAAHDERCGYARVSCPNDGCDVTIERRHLEEHLNTCPQQHIMCWACHTDVVKANVASHSCLRDMMETVERLQTEVETERNHRLALEEQVKIIMQQIQKPGFLAAVAAAGPAAVPAAAANNAPPAGLAAAANANVPRGAPAAAGFIAAGQRGDRSIRPQLGDIVTAAGVNADGILTPDTVGWVFKDERDHQPFLVRMVGSTRHYWYRANEVVFVARPGTVVNMDLAIVGMPVVRGPSWKWGDQDGRSYGQVTVSGAGRGDGWCEVEWHKRPGQFSCYRVGLNDAFDLKVADMRNVS